MKTKILPFLRINNLQAQNRIFRSIVWFLRGCFFFLEKLIRYLNRLAIIINIIIFIATFINIIITKSTILRNAYIMTSMVGSSFCQASQDAFTLITSNILRGFFVNQVSCSSCSCSSYPSYLSSSSPSTRWRTS